MYHDVEREPIPFFLREVNLKKLSGHLFVTAKDFQITLNFMAGKLANGMSTRFDEKLTVILHLMGQINEEQYNFLSGLHQFSDDQVAGILLDQSFAKKKDVYYARIYQLRRIAISTFSLQQGKWIFTAGEPDPPLRETFEIPLEGILVEGARAIDHISLYAGRWQYDEPVLFNEIPMASEIYFTEGEREFYAAVQRQGRHSCQELIARLNVLPLEFWRSMLAFHLMGVVEFAKGEASLNLSAEIAALLELHQRLQQATADGPELLGLPASAGAAELEKAKGEFLARFAPERFGSGAAPEIKNIAREVCRRLQAVEVKPPPVQAPAAGPQVAAAPLLPDEWIVEMEPAAAEERHAEPAEPEKAEEEFELSAEFAIEPGPQPPPEVSFEPELPRTAAVPPAPPRAASGPRPAQPESKAPVDELLRPAAPIVSRPSLRMVDADREQAWDLMLKGKDLYEKHEYAKAIPLLKKAIKLQPGQGDFYHLLGLSQAEAELTHNEAEINLKRAIELKSWSADPVYALGILYRRQGKVKLAERCFQRVKEISYEHTGASRELVDLRRQKAGGKVKPPLLKKKIF